MIIEANSLAEELKGVSRYEKVNQIIFLIRLLIYQFLLLDYLLLKLMMHILRVKLQMNFKE